MSAKREKRSKRTLAAEIAGTLVALLFFGVPAYFVLINSMKTSTEAARLELGWPNSFEFLANYGEVITANDGRLLLAFFNSAVITVFTILLLIIVCSMAAFVLARRQGMAKHLNYLVLVGLMIPPAIVPTIWVLQGLGLFKTFPGIIFLETALRFSFACILYRAFVATIPKELDEAALIDGCGPLRLFFQIIFPLLKPVTSTIIVLSSIQVYNDFENMLYFFPGSENATVQLTLYNYTGLFGTSYNLLFANVILICIPMLILFIFFNKRIVSGMTAGAVKG
ncbi:carbohydrate ABC transporter permease [Salibacterium halotolerans]|uniref:Raffinose/stachyose/melibiose transport system permease protein n=1 Tax=Salibacterium halotolerans TaxID=1884432 RepID=A0A1I5PS87_9BACI|nr:carbohydrate ABC transporter permease [Salibacterium halotolerans]SFP36401.1 raffinose/stachyose/melibiose transport system permease protein [Salibacterium halotolerans]